MYYNTTTTHTSMLLTQHRNRKESLMRRGIGSNQIHLQGWTKQQDVATVTNWLLEQGNAINNRSQLVSMAFEMFAEIIVENGGKPILHQDEIDVVFDQIGKARKGAMHLGIGMPAANSREMQVLAEQALEMLSEQENAYHADTSPEAIVAAQQRARESYNAAPQHSERMSQTERNALKLLQAKLDAEQEGDATHQEEK